MNDKHDIASNRNAAPDLNRAAEALRILATDEHAVRRFDVPSGCAQRDGILFASSGIVTGRRARLVELAGQHGCDVIDIELIAGEVQVSIGLIATGQGDWLHRYSIWRSPNDAAISFVSSDPIDRLWFKIDRGSLAGCRDLPPYGDREERELGLRLGDAALRRLAIVC